ncbi:hypothetical protein A7X95_04605 [Candidatus Nitrosopelagicus brevis]|uniref:Phosphoribosyl transferase domain protein n=1 Tax=Candidatus Nitrosopelagicus brevis TaxID=1410606 RepID=A0A0A7V7S0_9ARCH|nr:phosphoribosyltransferase family protein [Candidatus Nitrosopelagicus brevis]AJA92715.1 phosphoribosyl transferase domain protein [Candidatus Nitrosopelagicus brevis]PTL87199.1 hypothetical protein A7X95_04605 [Candidatus Nitrosopelagicus brevis]
MNNLSENEWKIKSQGDHYELFQYDKRFKDFLSSGIYNITVNLNICEICGLDKRSNLDKICHRKNNHERLKFTDGVFQIGYYYNRHVLDKKPKNDQLTTHIQNLKDRIEFAEPLAMVAIDIIKNNHNSLLEADFIIPVPSFSKDNLQNVNAYAFANEIHRILQNEGHETKLLDCIKKTKKIKIQKLTTEEEISEAVNDLFAVDEETNLTGKKILLVDDNLTSGNTAGKCAELLKNNGAEIVWVFVAGRTI